MNKIAKKIFLFGLLSMFALTGLTACGNSEEGVEVSSANALARKLAKNSAVKIIVSEDIVLDEPIVVKGEKEIIGNGTITAAVEDGEELYMITVADGGKLTVRESVTIDANNLMGGIHVENGGSAIIQEEAVVKNATEETANALVEGSFEVAGGKLQGANGHNIYNKKETVVSSGEIIGSGSKYAGVYNEATLKQTGGTISKAYNNVSNVSGSTFTFEGGTNVKSKRDGVFVAEGATITATSKEATIEDAGARGIVLNGTGDIQNITVKDCADTLIKVGKQGVLNMAGGVLQEGNYHGVDNAGTFTMTGGAIQTNVNCGIVNTGTLKVTGGSISSNENKGILNKHAGKADVTSSTVTLTSNKIAIGNEDNAVFEFANAKILMSTMTNIYCYDGTINLHDAALNASTSNNVRVIKGTINMKNVEVKGNSQKSGTSHHGIIMDGGVINAEDVTISMTTGCGMRVKGGTFNGKNIVMHDINRTAVSMGPHDYLEQEGLINITGLEVQSTNYNNVLNGGGGTIKITNAKLAVAASNSVRADGGRIELTNATIPGHKEGSKDNIHGFYLEGGEIVAKNITMKDIAGHALRNKNGKFVGTNITMTNIKGSSAISNAVLDDEHKNGIIEIDGLTIKDSFSKNVTLDCGVTTLKNATLGVTGGNNIKLQNNAATLNLYNVKVEGQTEDATASTHGIMVEGGNVYGENVQIYNTKASGIRCKLGVVDLKNVTMTDLGEAGISNGKMTKDGVELGAGEVKIDGLTITKAGTNNITLDAGTVDIINAELGKVETNNHNVKTMGSGVLTMENTKIYGTSNDTKYSIIAEGGDAELTNIEIYDSAKSGIHANKSASSVKGTNILISGAKYGVTGSKGSISIDGLTTEDVSTNNILAEGTLKVTVKNSTGEMGLCATPGHNVKAVDDARITLKKVDIKGVTVSGKHAVMAEGGDFVLQDVVIRDAEDTGIRINTATSSVKGKNVTIINALNAITGTYGTVKIDGLVTEEIDNNNVLCGNDKTEATDDECVFTLTNATFCKTTKGHNVKATGANAKLVVETSDVNGVTASGKYGVIVEKAAELELNDVTIQDVKVSGVSAIYSNNASNVIIGTNVTIKDSLTAVKVKAGTVTIDGLTTESIKEKNLLIEENNDSSAAVTLTVTNGTLCQTSSHNVHVKDSDGLAKLENVSIAGTTGSGYCIITEKGGDAELKDVTITNGASNALHVNNAASQITGENVTITNSACNAFTSKGAIELKNSTLGVASGHGTRTTGGTITLIDTNVLGTSSGEHHAVMAEGGNFVLNNVTISGATASDDCAAICINTAGSSVTGSDVTISNANIGIAATNGSVNITGLTSNASKQNINASDSANVTVANAVLGDTTLNNVSVTGGSVTLTDVTVSKIYNTATLAIGGEVKASIYNDAAVTVSANSSLKGSAIVMDWAEDKLPTGLVGIQFSSAEATQNSVGTVTLGENTGDAYVPYYYGTQMILNDRNNMQYTVKNFAELKEVMSTINTTADINTATITVAGDIVVTEEIMLNAGKIVRIQDDGTVRTISRSADYTKGDLFEVASGASLTFASTGTNESPKLKIDGGSKNDTPVITEPDSSFVRNNGSLTVGSGVQMANAKGSAEKYCKALVIYAAEGSTTSFSGVMKSIVGQYIKDDGEVYGIAITVGNTQDFIISDAVIKDNYTLGKGIIRLEAGGKLTITNSTFENNESVTEAGVISDSGNVNNRLTISGSTFKNNKTSGSGGVMSLRCVTKDNVIISNTTFIGNTADSGAAINMLTGASITLSDCTFTDNVTTNTSTTDSNCGYGDIRLGGNHESGGIYISGKMVVDIYMNQAGKVNVVGELTDGSDVVANWRLGKITGDSFVGINFASEAIASASKEYITLSDNYDDTYVIEVSGTTGTLVKPIEVENETELNDAITSISESTDKIATIKVTKDFTISETVTIPEGVDVTIVDNGGERKLTRATKDITIFDVESGATFSLVSTSKDNTNPTLTIDGGSASITNSKGAALINASGTVYVGQGTVLTNNKSTGNNQGFGIYSNAGSNTTFCGVISNIVGTHSSVKGNVFVIKGEFTLKNAIVKDNVAVAGAPIRLQGGQLTAVSTTFQGNTTGGNGGALYVDTTAGNVLLIDGCTFTNNSTTGSGGAISIEGKLDANTVKNSKFINNTAKAGGAINLVGSAYMNLENCEFSGNTTTNTDTSESGCGYGDIRLGDNRTGAIRISGKMIVNIYMNQAGVINVVGELTEGSQVIANWRLGKITGNSFTGITFASAEIMEASQAYFELSDNYKDTYNLTFSGTNGILEKK